MVGIPARRWRAPSGVAASSPSASRIGGTKEPPKPTSADHVLAVDPDKVERVGTRRRLDGGEPDPGEQRPRREADRLEHAEEQGVLLEAIAAATVGHQLGEDTVALEADAAPERDVEILEGNSEPVRALQPDERGQVGLDRAFEADPSQIGDQLVLVIGHRPPVAWTAARSKADWLRRAQAAMPGPMRAVLRWLGTIILFLAAGLCFLPTVIPPFLDRIYYQGPASDHFDGERFVNPEGPVSGSGSGRNFFSRWASSEERVTWPRSVPVTPTVPPDRVDGLEMRVTWIGHATVLIQTQGLNILTDPMWSDVASPFPPFGPDRVRAPGVRFEDLPRIDLVLVSHNHYDHLDLPTLRRLWQRDRPLIVTSLGNDRVIGEGRRRSGRARLGRDACPSVPGSRC